MNVEDMAKGLIKALKADESDTNIEGVKGILNAVIGAVNADWEQYITQDTNEILAEDNFCCGECGCPIKIQRERYVVYVFND